MPIARFQMEDGRIARFEVPEGTTPEQAQAQMQSILAQQQPQEPSQSFSVGGQSMPLSQIPADVPIDTGDGVAFPGDFVRAKPPEPEPTIGEKAIGLGETALTTATGMTGGTIGMAKGFLQGLAQEMRAGNFGTREAADRIEQMAMQEAQKYTYAPRTEAGQEYTQDLGELAQQLTPLTPMTAELGMIAQSAKRAAPAAIQSIRDAANNVQLSGLSRLKMGTQLLDGAGNPTKTLRKYLNKQGLVYENLTPEAKAMIPQKSSVVPPATASGLTKKALAEQIKSGGRDDALAGLRLVNGKVRSDSLANKALTQGFREGDVQMIKTTSPETRQGMSKMLNIMERVKSDSSLKSDIRPSDVAGTSAMRRIRFIRNKADAARQELNDIAKNRLKGQEINTTGVINTLDDSLDNLQIKRVRNENGEVILNNNGSPVLDFKESIISKNTRSQKAIKDAVDLLSTRVKPDAYRAHIVKRQLDDLIDFNKRIDGGLSNEGRRVLVDLRRSLNKSVREVNPDYARVNDVLSQSIGKMDDIQSIVGKKYDLFDKSTDSVLGTKLRGMLSNNQSRIQIRNSLESADDWARTLGGDFKDSVKDLISFNDALDDRFGTTATSSFAGEITKGAKQAAREGGPTGRTLTDLGMSAAEAGYKKARGINDFGAFESMRDLLNRK